MLDDQTRADQTRAERTMRWSKQHNTLPRTTQGLTNEEDKTKISVDNTMSVNAQNKTLTMTWT